MNHFHTTAHWFGPAEGPLLGWVSAPTAGRLAAQGFCVLRIDYDGTGDSSGDRWDPGRPGGGACDRGISRKHLTRGPAALNVRLCHRATDVSSCRALPDRILLDPRVRGEDPRRARCTASAAPSVSVALGPDDATIVTGHKLQYQAISTSTVASWEWSVSIPAYGTIAPDGTFQAAQPGAFQMRACASNAPNICR